MNLVFVLWEFLTSAQLKAAVLMLDVFRNIPDKPKSL